MLAAADTYILSARISPSFSPNPLVVFGVEKGLTLKGDSYRLSTARVPGFGGLTAFVPHYCCGAVRQMCRNLFLKEL
jgi:hypothetical protein